MILAPCCLQVPTYSSVDVKLIGDTQLIAGLSKQIIGVFTFMYS